MPRGTTRKAPLECECAFCRNKKPFVAPDHLVREIANGNVVVFAGAGISTENKDHARSTLYEEIAQELKDTSGSSFPSLMSRYCEQPDGRIKLLAQIKHRIEYFRSFDDFYYLMTRFHRAISPIHTITDVITTNWDDFFERECDFDPFVYDSDLAFWDSSTRRLIKLHGSITNFGSLVATEADYKRSFARLNSGPLGAHLKSLISRKTVIYTGYSLSDENYIRILSKIAQMMGQNLRQSYFISPNIDHAKLEKLPIKLLPIETDGAYFFEELRKHLQDEIGIIKDDCFRRCNEFLFDVQEYHSRTADAFRKTKHPFLPFILSYQDGLIHALQRILRRRKTGEYHSVNHVHGLVHGYEHKVSVYARKNEQWNAS